MTAVQIALVFGVKEIEIEPFACELLSNGNFKENPIPILELGNLDQDELREKYNIPKDIIFTHVDGF